MSDLLSRLAAALAGRYLLHRELGRGGMATVYLAQDVRHDRPVALKVLHPELAATLGPDRFLREIKLAARLQHPHILSVHDSGETASYLWFTMPYVAGESLRERLRREKQLPVEEALRITAEAARALDYAHREGVIHRDVKPENILLTKDGDTLVADFGIARALSTTDDRLTETGLMVGTPAYMSPEQATGERELDCRTDIYSLGVVLYEMLAGEPPYTGPSAQAVLAKHFTGAVPRVRQARPAVSAAVEQALEKALAPVPADRFQSAAEFARALPTSSGAVPASTLTSPAPQATVTTRPTAPRRVPLAALTLGLGVLIGLGVLFAWRRTHSDQETSLAGGKVLAVLPFENQGAAQDEYFADGVTDAVRGKLAAVPGVQVIAGGSSAPYKKTSKPPEQVARELGARYLLTGTVRWDKDAGGASRVLVSPELVEVAVGRMPQTRWQQPFDAAFQDVFQLQADIAGRVAQALDVAIGGPERQALAAKPTGDSAAYDHFLRGNVYFERGSTEPDLRSAEGFYQKAVALDSTFALAYAQLSLTHDQLYWFYYDRTPERLAKQKEAADRAVRLRPDLAEAHLALGFYYYHARLDYDRALDEFEAARKRQPSNGKVYFGMGAVHRRQDKWSEAAADIKHSVELNPRSAPDLTELALTLIALRTYAEAEPYLTRAIEISPDPQAYFYKSLLYLLWRGDTVSAAKAVREAIDKLGAGPVIRRSTAGPLLLSNPWLRHELLDSTSAHLPREAFGSDTARYHYWHAQVASYQGRPEIARVFLDSARVILEAQAAGQPDDPGFHRGLGLIYAELGRRSDARREGERAVALRPRSKDAFANVGNRTDLARILTQIGDVDAAIDHLAYLVSVPSYVSVPLLRVDHTWDPLRGNPRFERLLATK